jgi:hypothetical protein
MIMPESWTAENKYREQDAQRRRRKKRPVALFFLSLPALSLHRALFLTSRSRPRKREKRDSRPTYGFETYFFLPAVAICRSLTIGSAYNATVRILYTVGNNLIRPSFSV